MAVRKIYEAIEFKELDTYEVVNGVRTPIRFSNSSPNLEAKGRFVTSDPELIKAMDASIARGKCAYKCILTEEFFDDEEPLPDEIEIMEKFTDQPGKPDEITKVPGIKTLQDARTYLNKEMDVPFSRMPNGKAIKNIAEELKIEFPDLP
jgi:hypothetical protein